MTAAAVPYASRVRSKYAAQPIERRINDSVVWIASFESGNSVTEDRQGTKAKS
jgi:hypothetical protein